MTKLNSRITSAALESSSSSENTDLIQCPFCIYAEFKDPEPKIRLRSYCKRIIIGVLAWFTFLCPLILANITLPLIICIEYTNIFEWKGWDSLINSSHEKFYGRFEDGARTFKCLNRVECGRESCRECGKEWAPFHDCLKDEKDGLRLYVEKAMADAVKRTVNSLTLLRRVIVVSSM